MDADADAAASYSAITADVKDTKTGQVFKFNIGDFDSPVTLQSTVGGCYKHAHYILPCHMGSRQTR